MFLLFLFLYLCGFSFEDTISKEYVYGYNSNIKCPNENEIKNENVVKIAVEGLSTIIVPVTYLEMAPFLLMNL